MGKMEKNIDWSFFLFKLDTGVHIHVFSSDGQEELSNNERYIHRGRSVLYNTLSKQAMFDCEGFRPGVSSNKKCTPSSHALSV